jgi:hypothetical protein
MKSNSLYNALPTLLIATASFLASFKATSEDVSTLNLSNTIIVTPAGANVRNQKAVEMLVDEVEKRTSFHWNVVHKWPKDAKAVIAVGLHSTLPSCAAAIASEIKKDAPKGAEGYVLRTVSGQAAPTVFVSGHDDRGVLFGVGNLLRELRMSKGSAQLPASLFINTAPEVGLRGHQAGYRPKVNTYDAWTVPFWEQHIRDMAVFGTNALEMIPPRSDDDADSPHFPLPQIDMMGKISQLCDDYGIDVWIWYPAMEKDYSDPATVEKELEAWDSVFKKVPRIDAICVPGGDPGHTQPKYLMALLEKQTAVLHKSHPKAQMWVSSQGFTGEWMDEFVGIMQNEQPKWLTGVVFGPQNRLSLEDMRKAMPKQYPIRHYPDITHSYSCQFPVQDWDVAYKLTEDREVINPRPLDMTRIYLWSMPNTNGFLTYSEGVNDDVNKILWSGLGWNSKTEPAHILREYSRYFIGPEFEGSFSKVLFALEQNWVGPISTNADVMLTLDQVEEMERAANPALLLNWRFQQVVYRANYDAYVQHRMLHETKAEEEAMEVLRKAKRSGAIDAMDEAERILDDARVDRFGADEGKRDLNRPRPDRVSEDLHERVSNMAEALYQSIRMQLSVKRFRAIAIGRGANFDLIDRPLNNVLWLEARFAEARALPKEKDRLSAIDAILNWTDPGPGGFYDDLGDPARQPHLVRDLTKDFDPENRTNPLLGYTGSPVDGRISWFCDAEARYDAPLKMRYTGLDKNAQYKIRAIYAGDKFDTQMRLDADDAIEIHPLMDKKRPLAPVEFDIPQEATKDGELTLTWNQTPGRGSSGRGTQVTEVWLIKK